MPKNIEDIIVPARKRTIRNIPIPENRRRSDKHFSSPSALADLRFPPASGDTPPPPPLSMRPEFNKMKPRRSRKGLWISISLALVVLAFSVLSFFNGATLSYVPKSTALNFENKIFIAEKSGVGLTYSVVKLSKDKGLEVAASGQAEVSRKAGGTIIVYNNASTEPQRLIENTRFETPEGLVYRIPNAIVIPGRRTVNGEVVPGSIESVVAADQAGAEYNIGPTDFTVPGLSGTPRFTTIYARSKTVMSGGFVGIEASMSEQDRERALVSLESALRDELIAEARAQVPKDFILVSDLAMVKFEELPQSTSLQAGMAVLNLRGSLEAPMFKRSQMSNLLARDLPELSANDSVDIIELDMLDFSYEDGDEPDLVSADTISFIVNGSAILVWNIDEVSLKADLLGKHKNDMPAILNNYPTIVSATVTTRPFWKSAFPEDGASISIIRVLK